MKCPPLLHPPLASKSFSWSRKEGTTVLQGPKHTPSSRAVPAESLSLCQEKGGFQLPLQTRGPPGTFCLRLQFDAMSDESSLLYSGLRIRDRKPHMVLPGEPDPPLTGLDLPPLPSSQAAFACCPRDCLTRLSAVRTVGFCPSGMAASRLSLFPADRAARFGKQKYLTIPGKDTLKSDPLSGIHIYLGILYVFSNPTCRACSGCVFWGSNTQEIGES